MNSTPFPPPVRVDDANFAREVLNAKGPVLLLFWREGCGPCRLMVPNVKVINGEFGDRLTVAAHEVTELTRTVRRNRVTGTPTLILFNNGREVWRHTGLLQVPPLRAKLDELLTEMATPASPQPQGVGLA